MGRVDGEGGGGGRNISRAEAGGAEAEGAEARGTELGLREVEMEKRGAGRVEVFASH